MHEVDQDVVVMYTLVKIYFDVFDSYKSLWGFLRVLRVLKQIVSFILEFEWTTRIFVFCFETEQVLSI